MKALKIMSIIGLVYFLICFVSICLMVNISLRRALALCILALFYALQFSITGIVISSSKIKDRNMNSNVDMVKKLTELSELKEKKIINEQEFDTIKARYLNTRY